MTTLKQFLLLPISLLLLSVGCWEVEAKPPTSPIFKYYLEDFGRGSYIIRLIDTEAEVICYKTNTGLSCLPCSVVSQDFCK